MAIDRGPALLALARGSIAGQLGGPASPLGRSVQLEPWLQEPGATFVSLYLHGELRGCIGSLQAERPLRVDVEMNAKAAAFRDPRFPPVSRREFPHLQIEVSLLSALEALPPGGEVETLRKVRPGVDGLLLEYRGTRGTFLPQVWEQLPEPVSFLAHLKRKAGLPEDFWAEDIRMSRYTITRWKEPDPALAAGPGAGAHG